MSKRILFAGPSLYGLNRSLPPGLELRPPAGQGDLLAAALEGATAIGLIDGIFEYGASVWHKEILFALDHGIPVFGAASMGALRAAECAAFGMVGLGAVFQDYATGRRVADEDVAIVHGPAELGYPPLTEALVDIDATLDHLRETQQIATTDADRLSAAARRLHFKQRNWDSIIALAKPVALDIKKTLRAGAINRKREDALLLLSVMADHANGPAKPSHAMTDNFSDTLFFQELRREVEGRIRRARQP